MTDDPAWVKWRSEGIGASDVAASWTNSYGGTYNVIAKRLGHAQEDIDPHLADRGHRWEQPIADAIHTLTGYWVVGEQAWCEHPDQPHRRATVDGFLATHPETTIDQVEAVLELKTSTEGGRPNWDYYEAQIQAQLHVTGIPRALLVVAVIDRGDQITDLRLRWYDADPDTQTMLAAEYDRLWAYVTAGQLPEPDDATNLDAVKQATAHANLDADAVDLEDLAELIEEHHAIKTAVKEVTDRRDHLDAIIRHRIGEATKGICDGWNISYSKPARILTSEAEQALLEARPELGRQVLDRDKAKTELGDELDDWKTPAGARRLTINPKKGNR